MIKDSINKSFLTKEDDEQENISNTPESNKSQTVQECRNCDNTSCKCQLIMAKIEDIIELATQIEHTELFNIMLTIHGALKTLHDDETSLNKILSACEETYAEINPKEMNKILN
jgi:hypothetical protein